MQTRRLFIGIPLSPPLAKRLMREVSKWPESCFLKTREENLHVTLLFLGFIGDEHLPDMSARLLAAARSVEPFEIAFTGIRLTPDVDDPKIAWLVGEPSAGLRNLRRALEEEFGFALTENLGFQPHVTLARIKRAKYRALEPRPEIEVKMNLIESVDTVTLFESAEVEGKRRYVALETAGLGEAELISTNNIES